MKGRHADGQLPPCGESVHTCALVRAVHIGLPCEILLLIWTLILENFRIVVEQVLALIW